MKKAIPFIVVFVVNLLTLTAIHGQTLKMPTPQLKDYDVKNYLPKVGSTLIKDNSAAEKTEPTETPATKLLSPQLQKATLLNRNGQFDIYQLPIDQMPCIVPNNSVSYKMNFPKKDYNKLAEHMPNSMQKQNWLPGELKKGNAH
jgi:hypothetical protein